MKEQFTCKHFSIEELVRPETYHKYGQRAWQFLDANLLLAIDLLRDEFGACTINDWKWGGNFVNSGLRAFDYGGLENHSLHKMGKAADLKFKNYSVEYVIERILAQPDKYFMIKGIELGTDGWVHIDVRNVDTRGKFFTFRP